MNYNYIHLNDLLWLVIDCGDPPVIENTVEEYTSTIVDSIVWYSCAYGYEFDNGASRVTMMCSLDITWVPTDVPKCQSNANFHN